MALIKCYECGNEISEKANSCPSCGYSLVAEKKKADTKRGAFIFLIIVIGLFLYNYKSETKVVEVKPREEIAPMRESKSFVDKADIEKITMSFKTFDNESLIELLSKYGLKIDGVFMSPIESFNSAPRKSNDKDGDMVTTISIVGSFKSMPCGLTKWIGGLKQDNAEIIYRNGEWITDDEDLDPILYWASNGKCSAAYGS